MPITKSAKKKLRQNKKKEGQNLGLKKKYKEAVKGARKNPNQKTLAKAFSLLDKAVKKGVIHRNKAARLKSQLSHGAKS